MTRARNQRQRAVRRIFANFLGLPLALSAVPALAQTGSGSAAENTVSLPDGAGTPQSMGERFRADLSTGTINLTVPLATPRARGGVQSALFLSYSSSSGSSVVGNGFTMGVPFVARETDRGTPRYVDPSGDTAWDGRQDRFTYNGQELVPICRVSAGLGCTGVLSGEVMPDWSAGWRYFRPRVESEFVRIFWSPDGRTWRVQDPSGLSLELGVPLDGSGDTNALETDLANGTGRIFRWNIARQYDTHAQGNPHADAAPRPYNAVVYRYLRDNGITYLADIFDTPPAADATAQLSTYAHHTRLTWESRPDVVENYRRGWLVKQALRLARVDVSSKSFAAPTSARRLVRRYHLTYHPDFHASQLKGVEVEGRCSGEEDGSVPAEDAQQLLPATTCARLPSLQFDYVRVTRTDGTRPPLLPEGFEGFDTTVQSLPQSPRFTVDGVNAELFDINSDGLPDLFLPQPQRFSGDHGLILNGANGTKGAFGNPVRMPVTALGSVNASVLLLSNQNVVALDPDGDGVVNLVHMPPLQRPAIFAPVLENGVYRWAGRTTTTDPSLNPKIDMTNRNARVRVTDVDGDGVVDIVVDSGTRLETYFSLARHPNGDGKFGQAIPTAQGTLQLSADPRTACVPSSGSAVKFSDPAVRFADVNADGIVDILRLKDRNVEYWPGRGNGVWGTGDVSTCVAGTFGQNRHVAMTNSPAQVGVSGSVTIFDDVNGDGFPDLMLVGRGTTSLWLNIDGQRWSPLVTLTTPQVTPQKQIRLIDINGSGTKDLVWAETDAYRYIDLLGGKRPGLLTQIQSGLGHVTEIAYASSIDEMFAARAAGTPWSSAVPHAVHIVKRVTVRDRLDAVGRAAGNQVTEYGYRDPAYDGRSRAFRGFREATSKTLGDAASPTSVSKVTFLVGDCAEDGVPGRCAPQNFFHENSRDALRGLVSTQTASSETGVALSTSHRTYRLRNLYTGLDGSVVRYVFSTRERAFTYDTSPFDATPGTVSVVDVETERQLGTVVADGARNLSLPSTARRTETRSESVVDPFGNVVQTIQHGCVAGCSTADELITTHTPHQRPEGDGSGWLFRPSETYKTGSRAPSDNRHHTRFTYDARGQMINEWAELRGTLALERFHETGAAIAPAPPGASQNGSVRQATVTYDSVGNISRVTGARNQCQSFDYEAKYRDFVVSETTYAGTVGADGCGATALTSRAEYDRGLGVTRRATGFNGDVSRVDFDAFGRKTAVWQADPDDPASLSGVPSATFEYILPTDPATQPYFVVHSTAQDGETAQTASSRHVYEFFDGLGRLLARLTQADPSAGDGGDWVVDGLVDRSANGGAFRHYDPWFWSGAALSFPLSTRPNSPSTTTTSDAFGRPVVVVGPDSKEKVRNAYHAMSIDTSDAADLSAGKHAGTYSSAERDGHGRQRSSVERIRVDGVLEERKTAYGYLASGELETITRSKSGSTPVVRWMRYDSLGRMVLNVEPNVTKNFSADTAAAPETFKAWRYAHADDGKLVGTSDARGCGVNYHHDAAGRIVAEDFSPCLSVHEPYSALDLANGNGSEAFHRYDAQDPDLAAALPASVGAGGFLGRLASLADRGSRSLMTYDGRGRVPVILKRVAKPGAPNATLSERYAPHWYQTEARFDGADRVLSNSTGAETAGLLPSSGESRVHATYSKRGRIHRVGSSYGDLIFDLVRNARGMTESIAYGDLASTESTFSYDGLRRLSGVRTFRSAPELWSDPPAGSYTPPPAGTPSTLQQTLVDTAITYDDANNPTRIQDNRISAEWPAGAKPYTRDVEYDDLYRVTRVSYSANGGNDSWKSPFDAENRNAAAVRKPSPHTSFSQRVRSENFSYDWLGNSVKTLDNTNGFYDRSLGTIENGTAAAGPYRLTTASNRSLTGSARGDLSASYDDAGNLTLLVVRRDGTCLPTGASCYQRLEYTWDEVGRLARVKRWDLTGSERTANAAPARAPNAELRYGYDYADSRVTKTAVDPHGTERHSLYVFDSLEHHGATFSAGDYVRTASTEVVYLMVDGRRLGRVVPAAALPSTESGPHVFLELTDQLGSMQVVIDKDTSELVEYGSYRAYGDTESDYRPTRWNSFREHYKFTGQDQDIEVGLQYFGKRYYSANLGRWISADPLTVHNTGADLNAYAYVHGRPLVSADPDGQCELICASILIGAATSALFEAGMQLYQHGEITSLSQIGYAAAAGAVGGLVGLGVGNWAGTVLAKSMSAGLAKFGGAVAGGMAGGVAGGITSRGLTSTEGLLTNSMSLEDAISTTFNPTSMMLDVALGAASGVVSYGVNQLLTPRSAAGSAAPSRPAQNAKALTNMEVGRIGEDEIPSILRKMGAHTSRSLQNASGHGLDGIGISRDGTRIFVAEAKATRLGRPPSLSRAQSNMNKYLTDKLRDVLADGSNYSPEAKAFAGRVQKALAQGATIEGVVVETRYVGSSSQFTQTRAWTNSTQRSGARLPAPTPKPPLLPATNAGPTVDEFRPWLVPRMTCYTTANKEWRCDTTVGQW